MNADRGTTPRSIPLLRLNSQKLTKLLSSLLLKTTGRHLRRPGKGYSAGHLMLWMLQFFLVSPSYYPDCQCLLFFAGEVMPKSDKLLRGKSPVSRLYTVVANQKCLPRRYCCEPPTHCRDDPTPTRDEENTPSILPHVISALVETHLNLVWKLHPSTSMNEREDSTLGNSRFAHFRKEFYNFRNTNSSMASMSPSF